jgi:hypothetical protein
MATVVLAELRWMAETPEVHVLYDPETEDEIARTYSGLEAGLRLVTGRPKAIRTDPAKPSRFVVHAVFANGNGCVLSCTDDAGRPMAHDQALAYARAKFPEVEVTDTTEL